MRVASLGCAPLACHTAAQLDALARNLARALAEHEYRLSCLVLASHRSDTWRHLGYATEAHYARERLGMSRSSFMARCALAAKLVIPSGSSASSGAGLPHIAEALANAKIGVEAAQQLARVATPSTELAWLERARHRTIKHLREEVVAALTARRISGERDCPPPAVREIEAFHELERAACSGRIWRTSPAGTNGDAVEEKPSSDSTVEARGAWRVMLTSLREWLRRGIQTSAVEPSTPPCSAGRVTLRLRVSRATHGWWRSLESQARRWLPRGMSWLRFCCLSLWRAWRHLLDPNVAYGHIYIRDRYRCTSPVCNRKDVTPHHLRFRSHGGSDGDENVASVCTWCHLLGIHAGRIRAVGVASHIHWEIGPKNQPCVVVNGRKRESQ